MTATRSAISATTPKSWVMNSTAVFFALLQIADQRQDLRLRRDVERGRRFVGDQHPGIERQRHRDHGALALAARQFVRIGARGGFGSGMRTSSSSASTFARIAARDSSVWIENISPIWSPMVRSGLSAVIGSWKIIAMPAPRTCAHFGRGGRRQIPAFEHHAAAVDAHPVRQQPHDGVGHHRLAGSGFADHAEDFVGGDRERHAGQRMRPVGAGRQPHAEPSMVRMARDGSLIAP